MLVSFEGAREWAGDEVAFQICRRVGGGYTGCGCEIVDEFENEEAGECAAKVGDAEAMLAVIQIIDFNSDLRCQKGHISTADGGIGNPSVESGDGDEHDCVHEGRQNVLADDNYHVPCWDRVGRVDHDSGLR